jgi:hypothetical protein
MTTTTNAKIIQRHAIVGRITTHVREFLVSDPYPDARHATNVCVAFMPNLDRYNIADREDFGCGQRYIQVSPSDNYYLTIENYDGEVLYDSRVDVPCDLTRFYSPRAWHSVRLVEAAE